MERRGWEVGGGLFGWAKIIIVVVKLDGFIGIDFGWCMLNLNVANKGFKSFCISSYNTIAYYDF